MLTRPAAGPARPFNGLPAVVPATRSWDALPPALMCERRRFGGVPNPAGVAAPRMLASV